jgi:hypothetical protein
MGSTKPLNNIRDNAMNADRTTHTKTTKQFNELALYRLDSVETKVDALNSKFDRQDNIKKADLDDFKHFISDRINEFREGIQDQINELKKEKASSQELRDFKRMVYSIGAFLATLGAAVFSYLLNKG